MLMKLPANLEIRCLLRLSLAKDRQAIVFVSSAEPLRRRYPQLTLVRIICLVDVGAVVVVVVTGLGLAVTLPLLLLLWL